jgi:hypothetical protein
LASVCKLGKGLLIAEEGQNPNGGRLSVESSSFDDVAAIPRPIGWDHNRRRFLQYHVLFRSVGRFPMHAVDCTAIGEEGNVAVIRGLNRIKIR